MEEAALDVAVSATELHNRVRALAVWPGAQLHVQVGSDERTYACAQV